MPNYKSKRDKRMMRRTNLFRYYFRYVQLVGWTAFLFACSEDSMEQKPDGTMETVRITIQTRANGEGISELEQNEYKIETLRMYVFSDGGKLLGYHYVDNQSTGDQQTVTFTLKLPTGTHTFYTIANEREAGDLKTDAGDIYELPGSTDAPEVDLDTLTVIPGDLESLIFSTLPEATYLSGGNTDSKDETGKEYTSPLLPMVSKYTQQVTPNGSVSISLTRSVAKMKFYFTTTGVGECYMGRGLYLYNQPEYGYLFPRDTYNGKIVREETTIDTRPDDFQNNPFYKDSYINQLNGRIILNCGWPDESESYGNTEHTEQMEQLDINRITADLNDPNNQQYDYLPQKSFYLFANPNISTGQLREDVVVSATKPSGKGYYLKILVHQHGIGQEGVEFHKGEKFYLPLPAVKANDCLSIYSVVTLDGHVTLTPHWMIQEWQEGGGNIEFN